MSIAITGEGIVSAIGTDLHSVELSVRAGHSGIGPMRYLQSEHRELPVGEVPLSNAEMKRRLGLPVEQEVSRTTLMGMMAVGEAIERAGVSGGNGLRVLLVSGTTVAGMDITEQRFGQMVSQGVDAATLSHHDCGSCTTDIAAHFGSLFTDFTTISTACSSAANAIIFGADLLRAGEADIVVAGGTEALSRFHLNGFNSLMILDHQPCRPFDRDRAGLNLGEGAAYVVMERASEATRRGAHIDAWLTGYGNACDAFHQTATTPEGIGPRMAMSQALRMASLQPQQIDWIHAHGTGTPDNDASESAAIRSVFPTVPPVSSTKALTGHTTSASGSISAVISILAMRGGFLPGNAGWRNPMEDGIVPTLGSSHCQLHNVVVNSFGFGGNDSSLVLSDRPSAQADTQIVGGDIVELGHAKNESVEALTEVKQLIGPMKARRMGRLLKSALLTSLRALTEAKVEMPDAIVTATAWGTMEYSEQLLLQLQEGERELKPTWFMQSTHNTISSLVAIQLGCHGYNITFSQGTHSREWAMRQARLLLRLGRCRTVLVGSHDESTELFNSFLSQMGREPLPPVSSDSVVVGIEPRES